MPLAPEGQSQAQMPLLPSTLGTSSSNNQTIVYTNDQISVSMQIPNRWEAYDTESGFLLTEHASSVQMAQKLRGLVLHVFTRPDSEFDLSADAPNRAWAVLEQITNDPFSVGDALYTEPTAFQLGNYDAAYYLLNNRDRTVSLLLAFYAESQNQLVFCHFSSLDKNSGRIRAMMAHLLGNLKVDGDPLDLTPIYRLPDPLVFPIDVSTS